jgi:hypothetical protein
MKPAFLQFLEGLDGTLSTVRELGGELSEWSLQLLRDKDWQRGQEWALSL